MGSGSCTHGPSSVPLSEYVSSTAVGSMLALLAAVLALAAVIWVLTRSENLAFGTALVLILGLIAVSFLDPTALEGLLPEVMTALSLFERFTPFVSGVFDLTSVVYYLTVIGVFLFLSVQSMEKRRYN